MPMLDLQRRWAEAFRIRLGEARESERSRPRSLDGRIRITSKSEAVVDAIAARYGGVTSRWREEHQLIFDGDSLRIVVLPGDACVGWWEQWVQRDKMPICTHRCDGEVNHQTGEPCSCPPVEERLQRTEGVCRPTTRLWVMLPDVAVVGAGRLETRSRIAAETFPQSVAVLQRALERGELIPATLRIVKVESSGGGKPKHYVVPRIEVTGVRLDQILAGGEPPRLPPAEAQRPGSHPLPGEDRPGGGSQDPPPAVSAGAGHLNVLLEHAYARWGLVRPREIADRVSEIVGRPIPSITDVSAAEVERCLQEEEHGQ